MALRRPPPTPIARAAEQPGSAEFLYKIHSVDAAGMAQRSAVGLPRLSNPTDGTERGASLSPPLPRLPSRSMPPLPPRPSSLSARFPSPQFHQQYATDTRGYQRHSGSLFTAQGNSLSSVEGRGTGTITAGGADKTRYNDQEETNARLDAHRQRNTAVPPPTYSVGRFQNPAVEKSYGRRLSHLDEAAPGQSHSGSASEHSIQGMSPRRPPSNPSFADERRASEPTAHYLAPPSSSQPRKSKMDRLKKFANSPIGKTAIRVGTGMVIASVAGGAFGAEAMNMDLDFGGGGGEGMDAEATGNQSYDAGSEPTQQATGGGGGDPYQVGPCFEDNLLISAARP